MSGRRPDESYGLEYGPLPPEHEDALCYHHWPPRGRAPWPLYHGRDYPGRPLEQRVRREPFGLSRSPFQPFTPFRILHANGDGSSGATINPRARQENHGLTDAEFRKAMEQLKKQTHMPSNPQKTAASKRGGTGILHHTRSTETEPTSNTKEEKACTICLEAFQTGEQVVATPCNHIFHLGCITPWVKGHGNCPVCRFALCERKAISNNIHSGGEVDLDLLVMMNAVEEALSRVTFSNIMPYH